LFGGLAFGGTRLSNDPSIAPPRHVPQIPVEPPEERQGRDHINFLLMLACLYVYRFANDLALLRHCEPLVGSDPEPVEWMGTAMRDAALQIHHLDWLSGALGET
jgi:hypothetical protein